MKNFILFSLTVISSFSIAQEKKWSLEECVNYALENNITVKQTELTNQTNEQDIIASRGQFLPSFSGNASHSLTVGSLEIDPGFFLDQSFHSTNMNLNVSQTVFNGFRNTNLYKQSKLNLEASELELARIKDDISLNVVNAYLNILFNQENLNVAQSQVDFSEKQLGQVKELVDAGVQPKGNLLDVQATLANDEQNVIASENSLILAKLTLAQLLQLPIEGFDIEKVEVGSPSEQLLYDNSSLIYNFAVEKRSEIKSAEKNIEISKLGTEISKSGYYPSLSFGYNYGSRATFNNLTNLEDAFFSQIKDNLGHSFSLSLNVPIFSRFQNKTAVAKSKILEENAQLNLDQAKLTLQSNIERAYADARAAMKTYLSTQKSLEAQNLAFENAQQRYDIGAMNSFDLEQTRNRLINAKASLINAKYDFVFKTKVLDFYAGKSLIE